jgi:hypothetical protein
MAFINYAEYWRLVNDKPDPAHEQKREYESISAANGSEGVFINW